METGPAPPAPDCKFLQAAARQPGEGAAAPGRAGGAAAAPRPHLKEKKKHEKGGGGGGGGRREGSRREMNAKRAKRGKEKKSIPRGKQVGAAVVMNIYRAAV